MSERARGPQPRGIRRAPPPPSRSAAGPMVFLIIVGILVLAAFVVGRPMVEDAFFGYVSAHDTLMKQDIVRSLIADRVAGDVDIAMDVRGETKPFVIARGETASSIAQHLQTEGIVRSALSFEYVLYDEQKEDALQSGTYQVSSALTPRQLVTLFLKAPGEQVVLTIIPGWRLTEIAAAVEKAFPKITKQTFIDAAVVGDRKNTVLAGLTAKTPLEGYLFPETYFFRTDATASQIVDTLLAQFESRVGTTLRAAAGARKMSIYDLVKLASIVEREARDRNESPIIAGVYQNRLDIGQKLDADPTIQYAKGNWGELTLDDLKLDSPYNTYLVAGLPPTPISNPGQAALEAAAHPAEHQYFYFVAKNDGTGDHAFAKTLDEQEANRVKYGNK